MCAVQNATCSVSAKKLSGLRLSTIRPIGCERHELFGNDLGRVEHVEAEAVGVLLGEHLHGELPFGIGAGFDRFPQVAAVEIGVGAGDLDRFVPCERMRARDAEFQWNFTKLDSPSAFTKRKRVHAEALHHAIAARDRAVRHDPHQHVSRFGHERHEIPERVVRGRRLRHRVVRLGLHRMDEVRELHRVLDEEHGNVVADEIPVAFVGVELDREAAHVARGVGRAALARDRRKAHEYRRALARFREYRGAGEIGQRLVALEVAVRAEPRACTMRSGMRS